MIIVTGSILARKDSFAATMDIGTFAALGGAPGKIPAGSDMMFSMGFADRSAHMYFSMPAATIKAMRKEISGG